MSDDVADVTTPDPASDAASGGFFAWLDAKAAAIDKLAFPEAAGTTIAEMKQAAIDTGQGDTLASLGQMQSKLPQISGTPNVDPNAPVDQQPGLPVPKWVYFAAGGVGLLAVGIGVAYIVRAFK